MSTTTKKRSIGLVIGSIISLLLGGLLMTLTLLEVVRYVELSKSIEVQGRVTHKREIKGTRNRSYDIQYVFTVGETKYTASDASGREDLWISIPNDIFNTLEIDSTILIAYSPENPKINRPIVSHLRIGDIIAGGILGFILLGLGLMLLSISNHNSKR